MAADAAREASDAVSALALRLEEEGASPDLLELARRAREAAVRSEAYAEQEHLRNTAREDLFREELRAELIDRESNSIRIAERTRIFFEKSHGETADQMLEKATAAAAAVEAGLQLLDDEDEGSIETPILELLTRPGA